MDAALTAVGDRVTARVQVALTEHTAALATVGPALTDFLTPARDLLGGGKRLRAQLCAAGWVAAGGPAAEATREGSAVVLAGSALELFQATALVHDDVMDDSLTRRGRPTAHRGFAAAHAAAGWRGSPGSYGQAAAIVLGDLLLAVSSLELERARDRVPAVAGRRARDVYDAMTAEVALGQYLDVRAQDLPWDDEEDAVTRALEVVRHKSARYSVEHPLVLGAALAGAEAPVLGVLSEVGLPLGEAFQLRDDDLGVFGDPAVTGKPAGDDLREGKRTVLLALALRRAAPAERARLQRVGGELTAGEVAELQGLVSRHGRSEHEALIAARHRDALAALDRAGLPARAQAMLTALADALTRRRA